MDVRPAETRCVLLDRDGVINRNRPGYVKHVRELALLPGSKEALARLAAAGYRVLVVTNQPGVGKGLISEADLTEIHSALLCRIRRKGGRVDAFYVCPHAADEGCDCRKPRPGLIHRAARDWDLDLACTWFVGDSTKDVGAARAAGCRMALVATGDGRETAEAFPDVPLFTDLLSFVRFLLANDQPTA